MFCGTDCTWRAFLVFDPKVICSLSAFVLAERCPLLSKLLVLFSLPVFRRNGARAPDPLARDLVSLRFDAPVRNPLPAYARASRSPALTARHDNVLPGTQRARALSTNRCPSSTRKACGWLRWSQVRSPVPLAPATRSSVSRLCTENPRVVSRRY